jgi:hypothetical protein
MSHHHDDGCGHESHDHGLPDDVLGYQDNLFKHIDRSNVVALNSTGQGPDIIKPWNERDNDKVTALLFPATTTKI